jgi:hypothetical protein
VAALGNISELGSDLDRNCFVYPQHVLGRKHGPQGYASYEFADLVAGEAVFVDANTLGYVPRQPCASFLGIRSTFGGATVGQAEKLLLGSILLASPWQPDG